MNLNKFQWCVLCKSFRKRTDVQDVPAICPDCYDKAVTLFQVGDPDGQLLRKAIPLIPSRRRWVAIALVSIIINIMLLSGVVYTLVTTIFL